MTYKGSAADCAFWIHGPCKLGEEAVINLRLDQTIGILVSIVPTGAYSPVFFAIINPCFLFSLGAS